MSVYPLLDLFIKNYNDVYIELLNQLSIEPKLRTNIERLEANPEVLTEYLIDTFNLEDRYDTLKIKEIIYAKFS
jgi:hypothetical protein